LPRRVEFEDIIGWSLRVGVLISAALIVFGLALIFYNHGAGTFKLGELIATGRHLQTRGAHSGPLARQHVNAPRQLR